MSSYIGFYQERCSLHFIISCAGICSSPTVFMWHTVIHFFRRIPSPVFLHFLSSAEEHTKYFWGIRLVTQIFPHCLCAKTFHSKTVAAYSERQGKLLQNDATQCEWEREGGVCHETNNWRRNKLRVIKQTAIQNSLATARPLLRFLLAPQNENNWGMVLSIHFSSCPVCHSHPLSLSSCKYRGKIHLPQ